MGYFANGFVFASEPDFKAATGAADGRLARGYKHRRSPVWLLDFWKPRGTIQRRRAPFCDAAAEGFRTDLSLVDNTTQAFLLALERLKGAVGYRTGDPEQGALHLALAVANAAACPAYFFAADDDETDLACRAVPGSLVSFGCRLDRLAVQYRAGRTTVTPLEYPDEDDNAEVQSLIKKISGVAGMSLMPPRKTEGAQVLYENPVAEWPPEAGDPARILGLGTWDPLLNLEEDFAVVFEHLEA